MVSTRGSRLIFVFVAVGAVLLAIRSVHGQPPDILRHYRFLPGHSSLQASGGIAGWLWDLTIYGSFDLATGYRYDSPLELKHYGQFYNVDAILEDPRYLGPFPYPGWDLDQTLNMTGLDGTFTNRWTIEFTGVEGQGWPMEITAEFLGPYLHLTGMNEAGCCDFYVYELNALARLARWPDFNLDSHVDLADLAIWMANVGMSGGAMVEDGDANGDGAVNAADFTIWRDMFGADMALYAESWGGSQSTSVHPNVPEPGTLVLIVTGLACGWWRRIVRGKRRR